MIDAIGGRKVLAALLVIAIGCGAVLVKGDIPTGLLQLLQVVFGAFVVGNGIEHAAAAYSSDSVAPTPSAPPAPAPIDLTPIQNDLETIKTASATTQAGVTALIQYVQRVSGGA